MIRLTLPYPPKELNPNQKVHWAVKAKHAKLCRSIAKGIAIQYKGDVPIGDLVLDLNFYPPDNRRRDDDNAISSFKNLRDGLAEGLGIDDVRFQLRVRFKDKFPGGKVEVKIYEDLDND